MPSLLFYFAQEPDGENCFQISDFNPQYLKTLHNNGFTFHEFYDDETEKEIPYTEIKEPEPIVQTELLPIITYQMWQETMKPLKAMMATTIQPAVALMPLSIRSNINEDYDDFIAALDKIDGIFSELENKEQ